LIEGGITVTAPDGFEVSLDEVTGYSASIFVAATGTLAERTVYVRLAASTDVGGYSGEIVLTSAGATQRAVSIPQSWVDPREVVVEAENQSKTYGDPDPVLTYYSDDPESSSFVYTGMLERQPGEQAGVYQIDLGTLDLGSNYTIEFNGGTLTIQPKALSAGEITLTRNGNAYAASADGVSGFSYSYSGRNGTSYGPSADAPEAVGDYTVTATITDPNFTGSASEDFTVDEVNPPQDHPAFKVISMSMVGTVCTMTWESQPGASYWIEATDNLADPQSWSALGESVSSQGATTTVTIDMANTSHAGTAKLFMRVRAGSTQSVPAGLPD
jgi:hypothetical protein